MEAQQPCVTWYPGETVITGIGQGYWLTTPLQLASSTVALANRGLWREPKMVQSLSHGAVEPLRPETVTLPSTASPHWDRVVTAMEKVMHGARGTARSAGADSAYRIAGKTGTAQVRGLGEDEEYDAEAIKAKYRDHALFVGFAPARDPRIAVAVIVENGGSGGATAAPVARQVMDAYLLDANGELRVFDE
ncbi:MAG: penicillin-binding transpeptidase domain-containing protein [Litorivicinus sp.]